MSAGAMIWLIIFLVAAITFFGVAMYAGINGFSDLKELLTGTKKKDENHRL